MVPFGPSGARGTNRLDSGSLWSWFFLKFAWAEIGKVHFEASYRLLVEFGVVGAYGSSPPISAPICQFQCSQHPYR